MANEEHLAQLRRGGKAWNRWRAANPNIKPDLIRADLRWAHLIEGNFTEANLTGAKLTGAKLMQANFTRANLRRADLSLASFINTSLAGANLTGAKLAMTTFSAVNLSAADFTRAKFHRTVLANVNLSRVHGLDTAEHSGPSHISIDTLYRSQGDIPEVFLRGAGAPDTMITYVKSLVGRPFEFYSCFISYSTQDQAFCERLYADLQTNGVRCWFAPKDIQAGRKVHEQIDEAIRIYERLLLILSSHSMTSEWVKTEIAKARQREVQEQRQVLFPVRLVSFEAVRDWECFDADTGKDSAREIREYFIPDFSTWKDYDLYQKAFQRLLRDLKPHTTLL